MSIAQICSPDGFALLESLPDYSEHDPLSLASTLRKRGYDANLVSEALTQLRLRERAREKFGEYAQQMLFTPDGAEQATRWEVSHYHAQWLISHGAQHVIDLGCGIGADSLAFAQAGLKVTAIDMNPETAAAARFNLRTYTNAQVIEADALTLDLGALKADTLWLDPARRAAGKRIYDPQQWQPSLSTALELASGYERTGVKIAPGIDYSFLPHDCAAQWISHKRSLLEAVIWLADAAPTPGRSAVIYADNDNNHCSTYHTIDSETHDPRSAAIQLDPAPLDSYIIEPDPAIIRSGAISAFASAHSLAPIAQGIAYLTGSSPAPEHYAQNFAVRDVLPLDTKKIAAYLREHGVHHVEIKKRGIDLSPDLLRKKLKVSPYKQQKGSKNEHSSSPQSRITLIASPLLTNNAQEKRRIIVTERIMPDT